MECLKLYEEKTCAKEADKPDPLFLSYIKPHPSEVCTLNKGYHGGGRIDTTTFEAHSVRGASSTAAADKGVMISDILGTADWSSDSSDSIITPARTTITELYAAAERERVARYPRQLSV